jgi:hypothetical protein
MAAIACAACKTSFHPRRSTARYCGDRCRVAGHRARKPVRAAAAAVDASNPSPGHPTTQVPTKVADVTLTTPILRASKPPSRKLDPRIVPDDKWPDMYRLRLPDGRLSVMVNLTRAKDALLWRVA